MIINLVRATKMIGGKLVAVSSKIIQTAKNIPPGVRTWAARGLLGASLFVRGPERIRALLKSLNQYAIDLTNDVIKSIPNAIKEAVKTVVEAVNEAMGGNFEQLMVFGIFCISALFACAMLFDLGPKLSFAGSSGGVSSKQRNRSSTRKK